jgi:hypothetical protein
MKSDIRFELQVSILVYRQIFGPIETTLKNGSTGNRLLPVNRSEILNLGTHPEFNSLFAKIWFYGVSKYDDAAACRSQQIYPKIKTT